MNKRQSNFYSGMTDLIFLKVFSLAVYTKAYNEGYKKGVEDTKKQKRKRNKK